MLNELGFNCSKIKKCRIIKKIWKNRKIFSIFGVQLAATDPNIAKVLMGSRLDMKRLFIGIKKR
jgi:hypothetical protein